VSDATGKEEKREKVFRKGCFYTSARKPSQVGRGGGRKTKGKVLFSGKSLAREDPEKGSPSTSTQRQKKRKSLKKRGETIVLYGKGPLESKKREVAILARAKRGKGFPDKKRKGFHLGQGEGLKEEGTTPDSRGKKKKGGRFTVSKKPSLETRRKQRVDRKGGRKAALYQGQEDGKGKEGGFPPQKREDADPIMPGCRPSRKGEAGPFW